MKPAMGRSVIACVMSAALAVFGANALLGVQALAPDGTGAVPHAYAASRAAKNRKAKAAYAKKRAQLQKSQGTTDPPSCVLMDLNGDGVKEMIVGWWPSIYAYRGGKAKRVARGYLGRYQFPKCYRSKKVVMGMCSDAVGGMNREYWKWKKGRFVKVVTLYKPNKKYNPEGEPYYWIKGKGEVTKARAKAYVKKLLGKSKATKIKFR